MSRVTASRSTHPASVADWDALRDAIAGEVLLPGAPAYERARAAPPFARFRELRPRAVVRCGVAGDVAEALAFARRAGLALAVRSGAHCFAGGSSTSGLLVDVGPMRSVTVADGTATVGAGARLGDVYDALAAHGVTIAAGCGPTVGIAGLVLGGGLGILGRRHGLTSDQLVAAEVVLADGRVVVCDERREPELFWALRGAGGGQFGVVTGLTLRTLPARPATSFDLVWPGPQAAALVAAWQAWGPDAPDELAASLLVVAGGEVAEPPGVHLFGAMTGAETATARLLDELVARTGADPARSWLVHGTARATKRWLAEHGPGGDDEPADGYSASEFFARPLPAEAIAALVAHHGGERVAGQARTLDFTPWGGAYARIPADATAFAHRNARFLLKHEAAVAVGAPAAEQAAAHAWARRSRALVHAWGTGGVYPNFPEPELDGWARAYHGDNLERLLQVKATYDPNDVFRFPQSLGSDP
jgi:FAD/FMN-containing dehydrogenase